MILPPEKAAKLTDYIGKEVTFGIRPEDVFAADKYESAHEHNTVEASVRVFEMLGAEVFLYLTVDLMSHAVNIRVQRQSREIL